MNINYDKKLDKTIDTIDKTAPPRLLLHACCAPCATYCLTRLLGYFDVTLYYANDNITDDNEWSKRLGELQKLVSVVNSGDYEMVPIRPLKLVVQDKNSARFFAVAKGLEQQKEGGARCNECFTLRLTDTKQFALDNDFDYFGTTLTVSPYKNSQLLNEIGLSLETPKLKWLQADFKKRNGYAESIQLSQKYNLYRQVYCGCDFSLEQSTSQAIQIK